MAALHLVNPARFHLHYAYAHMKKLGVLVLFATFLIPLRSARAGIASHATGKVSDGIPIELITGTTFGYDVSGLIIPFVIQPKEIKLQDVHPEAAYFSKISTWARPVVVQKLTIDRTNDEKVSRKYCLDIVMKPPFMNTIRNYALSVGTEVSDNWPDAQITGQHEEILASWNGRWFKSPSIGGPLWGNEPDADATTDVLGVGSPSSEGFYDYNYNTLIIANIETGDCGGQDPATAQPQDEIDAVQLAEIPGGCSGDFCGQLTTEYTGPTITEFVTKIIDGITYVFKRAVKDVVKLQIRVTAVNRDGIFANQRAKTGKCSPGDVKDEQTAKLCENDGQWAAGFIPRQAYKPVDPHALEEQVVNLGNNVEVTLPIAFKGGNSAREKMKDASCFATPLVAIINKDLVIGDKESYIDHTPNCLPETPQQCKVDTWPEIKQKLNKAITDASNEYGNYIPGGSALLNKILHVIFQIEVENDITMNPDKGGTYYCQENEAGAAGPFQIKTATYGDVTNECESEYMSDDLSGCKSKETQMSRCLTEDAAMLAARTLLYSGGRWVYTPGQCTNRENAITSYEELFKAVCNYGTGMCVPQSHLEGRTYCEDVFIKVGLPIPTHTCPAPTGSLNM